MKTCHVRLLSRGAYDTLLMVINPISSDDDAMTIVIDAADMQFVRMLKPELYEVIS